MTVIALCVNREGRLCLAADRMVGTMVRRNDVRTKVFLTNLGNLVGVSGCVYNVDVVKLCDAVDAGKTATFLEPLAERKIELGIIIVTRGERVAYYVDEDGVISTTYLNSAGSLAYTGDLGWTVHSLYEEGSLPSLDNVTSRIRHAHRAAGFIEEADVVVSDIEHVIGEPVKFPSVVDPFGLPSGHDSFLAYMTNVRVDPGPLTTRKRNNPEHEELLSELLDSMMDSANHLLRKKGV